MKGPAGGPPSWGIRIRSVLFFVIYNAVGVVHGLNCLLIGWFLPRDVTVL